MTRDELLELLRTKSPSVLVCDACGRGCAVLGFHWLTLQMQVGPGAVDPVQADAFVPCAALSCQGCSRVALRDLLALGIVDLANWPKLALVARDGELVTGPKDAPD